MIRVEPRHTARPRTSQKKFPHTKSTKSAHRSTKPRAAASFALASSFETLETRSLASGNPYAGLGQYAHQWLTAWHSMWTSNVGANFTLSNFATRTAQATPGIVGQVGQFPGSNTGGGNAGGGQNNDPAPADPTSYSLINADTDQPIAGLADLQSGRTIDLRTLGAERLNIRVNYADDFDGSVAITRSGATRHVESFAPFAAMSDVSGDYVGWTPTVGTHTFTFTTYSDKSAEGTAGEAQNLTLNFIRSTANTGGGNTGGGGGNDDDPPVVNPGYFDGMVVGGVDPSRAIPHLKSLGVTAVRLWWGAERWSARWDAHTIDWAKQYKAAGFKVQMVVNISDVPASTQEVKNFFNWLVDRPGVKDAVDRWEIGNEVNLRQYWKGTVTQFVQMVQKPAYEVLHPLGETVVGASISFSIDKVREQINAGYLNYCDIASYHHYGWNAQSQINSFNTVKELMGNKPLCISEWGLEPGGGATDAQFASMLDQNRAWVLKNTESAFYYRITYYDVHGGKGAVLDAQYRPRAAFYNLYKTWTSELRDLLAR